MGPRFLHQLVNLKFLRVVLILLKPAFLAAGRSLHRITGALEVVDEGFQVIGALLQIPAFLVTARLIMKDTNDEIAVDVLAAAGSVLEDSLGLGEVEHGLLVDFEVDFIFGFIIEVADGVHELL